MVTVYYVFLDNSYQISFHSYILAARLFHLNKIVIMIVCAIFFCNISLYFRWCLSTIRYVSGNVLPCNLSTKYISAKFSHLLSLSITSFFINIILIKSSDSLLSGIFIYLIVGYNIPNQAPQMHSFCCKIIVCDIWLYVYPFIRCPNRMVQNYFTVSTI